MVAAFPFYFVFITFFIPGIFFMFCILFKMLDTHLCSYSCELFRVPYGSSITKSSVLREVDTLYVTPRFDSSMAAKAVHDSHYNTAMLCLHSATSKSCFRATYDKDFVPTVKVNVADHVQAEYDVYYLLFTPGGNPTSTQPPILWPLGKVQLQSGLTENPVQILERIGPNAWRDSAFKMPIITPTDPQKYVPGISVFTPFFMIIFLLPWLVLVPMVSPILTLVLTLILIPILTCRLFLL